MLYLTQSKTSIFKIIPLITCFVWNLNLWKISEQNSSFHLDRIAGSGLLSRVQPANATHCEQDKYSGLTSIILKSLLPIHTGAEEDYRSSEGYKIHIHIALKSDTEDLE